MRRLLILIILLFAGTALTSGQEIKVTSAFDTSRIFIGDQVNYIVTVEQPAGVVLGLKPLKDTLCKNVDILAGPVTDSMTLSNGMLKFERKYLVTSYDSGIYVIPPFYAELTDAGGLKRFHSDYSFLEVTRVKISPRDTSEKIFDIVKPYKAPVTLGEILPWLLLAGVIAALIWGGIILFRRLKRSKKEPGIVINPDPAHIIAFRELERLKAEQLWQKGEVKLYYSRLTEIVRQYLENRYKVFSLEMTTSETLDALLKTGFKKDESYSRLRSVLLGADLVKFAKYKPEPSENEGNFSESWKFVEDTKVKDTDVSGDSLKGEEVEKS